ncbi:MAG: type II secretion system F family protein [Phycisphaerales bacterium]
MSSRRCPTCRSRPSSCSRRAACSPRTPWCRARSSSARCSGSSSRPAARRSVRSRRGASCARRSSARGSRRSRAEIARAAAGNPVLSDALARSADAVKHGEPLSKPLEESGLFAEDVVEMISVGESANNLPSVLVRLADTLEARIDRALSTLLRLMEPAMLLVIAAVVMFIFLALVVPMMQLSSQL